LRTLNRRLFCPNLAKGNNVLSGPEFHHARDVLRMKKGDQIELFDGMGHYASAEIENLSKSEMCFSVSDILTDAIIRPQIILAAAIPKYAHQETLVKMTAELGVCEIIPMLFERSCVREHSKPEKWIRWCVESAKQSGQNYLPAIRPPMPLEMVLKEKNNVDLMFFGDATGSSDMKPDRNFEPERILIFVGPEGGFTENEINHLRKEGAISMCVGRTTLRIETAASALTSILLFLYSDR
jgi:16S rRNA (uracil1498-N3)-methyltransferase